MLTAFAASVFVGYACAVYLGHMFEPLFPGLCVAAAVPMLATCWRRLHDIGLPGWPVLSPFVLFGLIPVWVVVDRSYFATGGQLAGIQGGVFGMAAAAIAALAVLALCVMPTRPGPNRYGPNPIEVHP